MINLKTKFNQFLKYSLVFLSLAVGFVLLVNAYVWFSSDPYIVENDESSPILDSDTVLLLGASVFKDGRLTPVMEDRAKTALNLYKSGKVKNILVSGDGRTNSYDEVSAVGNFLTTEGVPVEDILADTQGLNTFESLYRVKNVFGLSRIVVVSQKLHLYRAIFIGRNLDLDIVGVPAREWSYDFKNIIRELLATLKSVGGVVGHFFTDNLFASSQDRSKAFFNASASSLL